MSGRLLAGWVALTAGLLFAAGEPEPEAPGTNTDVRAVDCRVTFVERRTLAVEHPGILSEAVREGERVDAGQVVLRIRDAVPKSALAVAAARADSDADLRAAEKEFEAAKFEHQTYLNARPGTYTDIDIRRVQLAAETAALKVEQAKFEQEVNRRLKDQAADELGMYYVPSTISGLVTRAFKGAGEAVQLGEPVLEVVNTEQVHIEGFVPLADAWRVQVGMPVTVRVDLTGENKASPANDGDETTIVTLQGELRFVDVDVQPVSKVVRVWTEVPNPENRLRDGLTAQDMTIHTSGQP
ncbi:MAG: efflux RND transporter periplasmic adaptor subunit [Planctomycetaceae bacterium]|nr:efflux RND transporter periplasmic adaptor subunit [Planctomycetaceae bacterium]